MGKERASWRITRLLREGAAVSGISNSNWQIVLPPRSRTPFFNLPGPISHTLLPYSTHTRTRTHTPTHPYSPSLQRYAVLTPLARVAAASDWRAVSNSCRTFYQQGLPLQRIASAQAIPNCNPPHPGTCDHGGPASPQSTRTPCQQLGRPSCILARLWSTSNHRY